MMNQSSLPIRPGTPRAGRHAFTMVEILTVIGILALLTTITVVSIKAVGGNAQEKETRTRLDRLRNALREVTLNSEGKTRLQQVVIPKVFVAADNVPTPWNAVPASSANALFKTGQILQVFSANAAFRRTIEELPAQSKKAIIFNLTNNGGSNAAWTIAEPQPNKPLDATRYVEYTLPLDSWGNPIVFVFDGWDDPQTRSRRITADGLDTGGLTDLYSASAESYWEFATPQNRPRITEAAGTYAFEKDIAPKRATYRRLGDAFRNDADRSSFWFSAGKDGLYQTHDDNLYSFEGN